MTLREKILKTFVVTIREINTHGGPEKFFENILSAECIMLKVIDFLMKTAEMLVRH